MPYLGVRQLVRVNVADRADDRLRQRIVVQLQRAQKVGRAVVRLQGVLTARLFNAGFHEPAFVSQLS